MESGLPEEDSAQSAEGTLLHNFDANPSLDRSTLKPNQQDLLRISGQLDEFVFERVMEQFGISPDEPFEESRAGKTWWVTREGKNDIPGHTDRYRYWPARKLLAVIDTKYGFLEVTPAASNYQLRVYACAGAEKFDVANVAVAICQPRLPYEQRITLAAYSLEDIEASRKELFAIRDASRKPDAPLNASLEACRYCKARLAGCSAFEAKISDGMSLVPVTVGTLEKRKADLEHSLGQLTFVQRDKLIRACKMAEFIKEQLFDFERGVIAAGGESLYAVGKPSEVRDIVDAKRAVALLNLAGISRDAALDCCDMKTGAAEDAIRFAKKCTWKEAKDEFSRILGSVVEKKSKKPSLVEKKASLTA